MSGLSGLMGFAGAQMAPALSATPAGMNIGGLAPMRTLPTITPINPDIAPVVNPLAGAEALGTAGMVMSLFGAINGAIGTYYAAESQKSQLKQQASAQRFQAQMARVNARGAEFAAQQTLLAGAREMGRVGMAMGQRRASAAAGLAARGGQLGVGSTREIMASMDIVSDIDRLTMDANRVRAAEAQRMQAVNYQTQAVMAGVSASNLYGTAGTISSGLGAFTSLLGSAGQIGQTWAQNRRFEDMLAAMGAGGNRSF